MREVQIIDISQDKQNLETRSKRRILFWLLLPVWLPFMLVFLILAALIFLSANPIKGWSRLYWVITNTWKNPQEAKKVYQSLKKSYVEQLRNRSTR